VEIVCDGGETLGRIDTSYAGGCMGSWKKKGAVAEESEGKRVRRERLHERRQGESPQGDHEGPTVCPKMRDVRDRDTCDTLVAGISGVRATGHTNTHHATPGPAQFSHSQYHHKWLFRATQIKWF